MLVPVAIAGSALVIGTFPRAMGPSTASLTVAASATSWGLEIANTSAPWKSDSVGPQNWSVETTSALLLKPTFGWSPRQFPL